MKRIIILLGCSMLVGVFVVFCAKAQEQKPPEQIRDEIAKLIGNWSGDSICVNKERFPACHDEKVIYHITKVADKPNTVNLSADKIVNGKPEFMGAFDFVYDPKKQT
ncbi:MAG TPA: hypothetical protein VEV84_11040, partial [Pyrinomonadaceae bacterium]|nr:hypothetical protein [Pyrinomonadaceae bacterium]